MRYFLSLFLAILFFVSCKKEQEKQNLVSDFNLEKDYGDFAKRMTEQDTIKVWMNLSQCMYQGIEKLQITKKDSYLTIRTEFAESAIAGTEFVESKPIVLSVYDTIWKFDEFLKQHQGRIQTDSLSYGSLQISANNRRISFMTDGLGDNARLMIDYCNTMRNIMPNSEHHIYAGTVTD